MPDALLIAHGSPADPEPQERALQALAARVRIWCPGWRIRGTTLALPGALETAVAALPDALVFPFFMAEGSLTCFTVLITFSFLLRFSTVLECSGWNLA